VVISIQNEREWFKFCEVVLEDCHLASDPRFNGVKERVENRDALDIYINKIFMKKTRKELIQSLKRASIAFGALNSVESFSEHPQLRRQKVTLQSGDKASIVAPPITHSYQPNNIEFGKVPTKGEHTDKLRKEFGY